MFEKAARALAVEYYTAPTDDQYDKDMAASQWASFVPLARAVLLAIREPDEGMLNVGVDAATGTFEGWVDEGQVSTLFTAMIDNILTTDATKPDSEPPQ